MNDNQAAIKFAAWFSFESMTTTRTLLLAGKVLSVAWLLLSVESAGQSTNDLPDLEPIPVWTSAHNVRLWSGYKDNVLLGNDPVEESPFLGGGLDLTWLRLPDSGTEVTLFMSGDYIHYLDADEVDREVLFISQGDVKKPLGEKWTIGNSVQYLYYDQVFDASTIEREFATIQVQGQTIGIEPSVRRSFNERYWLELQMEVSRQLFRRLLDDYWEAGPEIILGREYGNRSDLTLSYEVQKRYYDTRVTRTELGQPLNDDLELFRHKLELSSRHYWDEKRRWRTVVKGILDRNEDNGGGYYDYWRYGLSAQLRYQAKSWRLEGESRFSYYDYDVQPVSAADLTSREKTLWLFGVRAQKDITDRLALFARYEHERSLSNLELDEYKVNTVFTGIDWNF